MKQKDRSTAMEVLSRFPKHYQEIAFQKFHFSGELVFINVRSKNLDSKPVLFLWSLDRNAFISSLFPIAGKEAFSLDVMNPVTQKREYYHLYSKTGEVIAERQGVEK